MLLISNHYRLFYRKEESSHRLFCSYLLLQDEKLSFYKKYIDEIFNSKNVNETILLINSMQKRSQELRGYLLSNLVSRREDAEKELADINYVFDTYKDKIEYLVKNGVLQRSNSSDALFRIE